ncbi:MAG: tagaturonate epimerase family protein [Phycisphaerae bacterium]|nr:tagaturonate epimerase family protein [Phycisphaerae bacterium]
MQFGELELDPAVNPAVLDTTTWDPGQASRILGSVPIPYWQSVRRAIAEGSQLPGYEHCVVYHGSSAGRGTSVYTLARLSDGQHVFIEIGASEGGLGEPLQVIPLGGDMRLAVHTADIGTVRRYVRTIRPDKGPRAMGAVPRLGIGTRMSTSAWPGIWRAMDEGKFAANAIQNSVRELNLLDDVLAGRPARSNYLYGFGTLEEGHTGSTFEGLWLAGVIAALKAETQPAYGADADHITVRCGPGGLERAKRVIDAARDYTFFTLDVSDIVNYALAEAEQFAVKYGLALDVVVELSAYIKSLKGDCSFDLELSIDECPAQMDASACLTTETELLFLIEELRRRSVPITHIAPNVGIVKGQDDTGAGGLAGFERRIGGLVDIATEQGIMLDFHSGDDLRSAARQAIGRATHGWNHFKVSPSLQVIFGEVLHEVCPERFQFWWEDTLAYARREAAAGSTFAAQCLRKYEAGEDPAPAPHHSVFHHYNFASVGRRDGHGQFVHRAKFYDLPAEFFRVYHNRIHRFLCDVAADVFGH